MNNRKFYVKTFLFMFIILTLLGCIYIRGTRYAIAVRDYNKNIDLNECLAEINQYESLDGKNFTIIGEDPWLLLDFSFLPYGKAEGLSVKLNAPIDLSKVKIYYGKESNEFSEMDKTVLKGEGMTIEANSREAFTYVRLNISQDFGISNISTADGYEVIYNNVIHEYIYMVLVNLFISAVAAFINLINEARIRLCAWINSIMKTLFNYRYAILKRVMAPIVTFVLLLGCEYIYSNNVDNAYFNIYRVLNFTCILNIGIFAIIYRNICMQYIHIYYFFLIMAIGTAIIVTIPTVAGTSWDEETHYSRVAVMSWGQDGLISYTDNEVAYPYIFRYGMDDSSIYRHEIREDWKETINLKAIDYPVLEMSENAGSVGVAFPAYITGAVGLIIGRGMGLSFTQTYMLGKWMNLLCYAILFCYSIKIVKERGKLLIAVIGIIPTCVCVASAYAYDWWIIGFIVLGYALCIRELQQYHEIRLIQLAKILLIMIIGILPKAIYFPLLLPIMFLDKKSKHVNIKRMLIVAAMAVLVSTFIIPMIFSGAGTGDSRGGVGVNSTEQIKFILNNPLQYTNILLGFLREYLSPDKAEGYLTYLSCYGNAEYYTLCILVIGIVVILDNKVIDDTKHLLFQKLVVVIACFASMVLVATALYVSFTPVAYGTIYGCQSRYILPVLFPFLFFMGKINIDVKESIKAKAFVISTSIMAFILLYGIYDMRIRNF